MMKLSKVNSFFKDSSVEIFIYNPLSAIDNESDGRVVVRVRCFAEDTFENSSVFGRFTKFAFVGYNSIVSYTRTKVFVVDVKDRDKYFLRSDII